MDGFKFYPHLTPLIIYLQILMYTYVIRHITCLVSIKYRGGESSLPVAHPGYQVLSDILFRLGLIANALTQCSA